MSELKNLCLKYTNLSDIDIEIIENIAKTIQFIADTNSCDVFIDCPTSKIDEAIVVAAAKPTNKPSLYKEKVVGKIAYRQKEPAVLRAVDIGRSGRDIKGITQENIMVKQSVEPITNNNGKVIGILIIEEDVTKNLESDKKIEILSQANEELTAQIFENSGKDNITYYVNDAILIFNEDGILTFKNHEADILYKKLGYKEDILGMDFSNLSFTNLVYSDIVAGSGVDLYDVEFAGMNFQIKHIVQKNSALNLIAIIKDVTDVKKKEKELVLKSVAIKEIHHRVKNNLQTIASLLRLQKRRAPSKEIIDVMDESISRILSIAVTHEILSKEGIDEVNIKEVINSVKFDLLGFEKEETINLKVNLLGDDIRLSSDNATSIALVVNEILQNCVKHAFKGRNAGEISIVLQQGNIYSSISITDDGVGFDVDKTSTNTLGLMIIKSLVNDKLEGNLNILSNDQGTRITFDFKN